MKKTLRRPPVDASSSDEEKPKKIAKANQRKEKLNVDEVFSSSSSDEDDHRRSLSVPNQRGGRSSQIFLFRLDPQQIRRRRRVEPRRETNEWRPSVAEPNWNRWFSHVSAWRSKWVRCVRRSSCYEERLGGVMRHSFPRLSKVLLYESTLDNTTARPSIEWVHRPLTPLNGQPSSSDLWDSWCRRNG